MSVVSRKFAWELRDRVAPAIVDDIELAERASISRSPRRMRHQRRAHPVGRTDRRRIRIANVVHSLGAGGTEKLVVDMSIAFADEFDVQVVCLDEPGMLAGALESQGITVHCVGRRPGIDLGVALRLAAHFRRSHVDIVHAHQCTPWIYAAMSRLLYPAPRLLLEEHGRFFPEVERRRRIALNRLLLRRLTHRFVAVSDDVRRRLERYEGLESEHIDVIHNGVKDEPRLDPATRDAVRRELGFAPRDFVVGTVGRFDPIKNLPLLVASMQRVADEYCDLRGLIVGDGQEFAAIQSLIRRSGLAERVRLTGFRDDARTLIQAMDAFVLASHSEGISVALLEAMAAAVPVIVTNVGGNPEIVIDGRTGWVVAANSSDALSRAILDSATDAELRRRLGFAARRRFRARFAFDRMINAYRKQYWDLCSTTH
jgi:glycosyltransferase involved in cell wall biosynthesis